MITLKSDSDIQTLLDSPSYGSILELMRKDFMKYSQQYGSKDFEWIPRVLLAHGSNHEGSKITFGFLLNYQFRKLSFCFDVGIWEIRIAENMDDFLDLYNEFQNDPGIMNLKKEE